MESVLIHSCQCKSLRLVPCYLYLKSVKMKKKMNLPLESQELSLGRCVISPSRFTYKSFFEMLMLFFFLVSQSLKELLLNLLIY